MNRRKTILTVGAAAAFAVAGTGAAMAGVTPSQTSTVTVDAKAQTAAPLDTGVVVNSQFVNLKITATGSANNGGGAPDSGADGVPGFACPGNCYVDGAQVGALVARFGDDGSWFVIGSGTTYKGQTGKHLYLGYNDVRSTDSINDNTGGYTVTVERSK